jgi:hypothetical protein
MLEHDPEKWAPIFGKGHAQTTSKSEMPNQPKSHFALAAAPVV